MTPRKPDFYCGYQGETEYIWKGERIFVRYMAIPWVHYNPHVYEEEILPRVGCIYTRWAWEKFPDPEFCAHFPGYVPAKIVFVDDPSRSLGKRVTVEYLTPRPEPVIDEPTGYVMAPAHYAECLKYRTPAAA